MVHTFTFDLGNRVAGNSELGSNLLPRLRDRDSPVLSFDNRGKNLPSAILGQTVGQIGHGSPPDRQPGVRSDELVGLL